MTSSVKPELYNISLHRQKMTIGNNNMHKKLVKIGRAVPKI